MLHESTSLQLCLETGEAVSLVHAKDCDLQCVDGMIWVTEEKGGEDIVLKPGDRHHVASEGRVVVQSLAPEGGAHCRLGLAMRRSWFGNLVARCLPDLNLSHHNLRLVIPRLEIL